MQAGGVTRHTGRATPGTVTPMATDTTQQTDDRTEEQTGEQTGGLAGEQADQNAGTPAPAAELTPEQAAGLDSRVESIIFSNSKPVAAGKIAEVVNALTDGEVSAETVEASVERLNEVYSESGRSFRIERVAGGFRVMTQPEYADVLAAFHRRQATGRLSRAAVESLAIIAYQQPLTRARLEAIRGVGCGEVLRSLLERRLISVTGRAEEPGRPMLYGTTRHFLDSFGIGSIRELPTLEKTPNVDLGGDPEPEEKANNKSNTEAPSDASSSRAAADEETPDADEQAEQASP